MLAFPPVLDYYSAMLPVEQTNSEVQTILVVDDSPFILNAVKPTLEHEGFRVITAVSGDEALQQISRHGLPHLAIVDLNMPGMDGFELCQAILDFSDLPIIMLTARGEESERVRGLATGADDYIVKPFRSGELVARVRRVLRRLGDFAYTLEPVIRVDANLQIDFPNRKAFVPQKPEPVQLTPTETKLLYILMRNAGRTVTNEFLLRRVWPQDDAYEDRLHTHVYRLRRKIEANPKEPHYILSAWGTGYSFLANPHSPA
ncbi:MAG TPA: response regulator transcription factor [Chloroflexota bacterium]|nr:response regulator transcription factor [Chloroflexota bacterium]